LELSGVDGVWWSLRSSKPLRPDIVGLGGFDSHTLPPTHARRRVAALLVLLALAPAAGAQQADSVRAGVSMPASAVATAAGRQEGAPLRAPISPRRAFLYSFVLPGAGQAALDRSYAGGMFFLIEVAALTLVHRSAEDLRIARRFAGDSMPLRYQVDPTTGLVARDADGAPVVAEWSQPRYDESWVRTRRLHYEDWLAVLFFNHLFAGADAFVAAQLWDLPARVGVRQTPFGPLISATFRFR
jgi:hypothetical protein